MRERLAHIGRPTRVWIAGAVSLLVLLGVGLATYLFGGAPSEPASAPGATPSLDVEGVPASSYEPEDVLRLEWGPGDDEVWADERWPGTTFETFAVDEVGRILIADHPRWHVGARVRRFSAEGQLERTWLTPSSSTLFEPYGDGIMYVLAREGGTNERIVTTRADGSVVATFVVPTGVHSTALLKVGSVLGVTVSVPLLNTTVQTMTIEEVFVPVVQLDAQGRGTYVQSMGVPGFGTYDDARLYARRRDVRGLLETDPTVQRVTLADGRQLLLPDRATPVGVGGDVIWMTMPVAYASDRYQERPAWPLGAPHEIEVLAGGMDGSPVARLAAPWSPHLAQARRRFVVAGGSLWAVSADADGLSVRRYVRVER